MARKHQRQAIIMFSTVIKHWSLIGVLAYFEQQSLELPG